jgi:coenzyme F420 hydrogenase subunit beta
MTLKTAQLIDSVVGNGLCAGCGICVSVAAKGALEMALNAEGYLRPKVHEQINPNVEAIVRDVCPGLRIDHGESKANYHKLWGPLVEVRTGHATANEVRQQGSSGGVISALSIYLLEQGQVDFVAQIAVSAEDPLRNQLQLSRSAAEVMHAAGSRYAPSSPLGTIGELLDRGERFAFIGKPCDIAALRRYALHDSRVDQLIPYMLSFMCAGIPSIKGTYELLKKLGADRSQLKSFRYRGDGWPGMTKAVTRDGEVFETDYNSSWGEILGKYLQFRCKICPDGTGEFADIVCADAWYGKDGYPDFTEREGRSLVISRTSQGELLVQAALAAEIIRTEILPVNDIELMQPYQSHRKKMVLGRVLATWLARGLAPRYRGLGLLRASFMANPLEWLRNLWGTFRRANGERQ